MNNKENRVNCKISDKKHKQNTTYAHMYSGAESLRLCLCLFKLTLFPTFEITTNTRRISTNTRKGKGFFFCLLCL